MKSKEEIFNAHSWAELGAISPSKSFCLKAMEEYAKQEAIAFGTWMSSHHLDFQPAANGQWIGLNMERISNEDLYEEYLKSKL